MIGKSSFWGPATASGGALVCAVSIAGWWFAQSQRPFQPETPRALETAAAAMSAAPVGSQPAKPPAGAAPAPVVALGASVDIARVTPRGDLVIAGRTEPGARVALLDNGETLMEAQADPATGEFVLMPPRLGPGPHKLSLRSGGEGMAKESAVMAFSVAPRATAANAVVATPSGLAPPATGANGRMATIARGDSLWRISRARLGRGSLYETIFKANSAKIHDPNLIYPDETLTIP